MGQVTATGWGILVTGLVLVAAFGSELAKYVAYRGRAHRVSGMVVELVSSVSAATGSARPRTVYHPVLEFTTPEGREVRTKMNLGTNPPVAREGQQVTVVYDPQDPNEAEIAKKSGIRPALLSFGTLLGVFFVGLFIFVVI